MSAGGKRPNSGPRVSVTRQLLSSTGIPAMIIEQLSERIGNNELETKDLISLLGFIIPKLKAVEIKEEPKESNNELDFSKLETEELETIHGLIEKMTDI
jgi:hypothetical protein